MLFACLSLIAHAYTQDRKHAYRTGAEQTDAYFGALSNYKSIGLVVNQTSVIHNKHLVDTLLSSGLKLTKLFSPEHGLRGTADAGEFVTGGVDTKSGLEIISLYGGKKKPTTKDLAGIDAIVYDIQDVGVRFFTYISTLYYVAEACAQNNIPLYILDRPNPNGDYVDGPILQPKFKSFVGVLPIPIVYGLTPGELAQYMVGERLIDQAEKLQLRVIPLMGYKHSDSVFLPIKPSPNLNTYQAIRLYPSLCLFEATAFSIGRGTMLPFQIIGNQDTASGDFTFTPRSLPGYSKNPPLLDTLCYGVDLSHLNPIPRFTLQYLFRFNGMAKHKKSIINRKSFFDLLAGTDQLRLQLESGMTEEEIRKTWQNDLDLYLAKRKKYLIYP
jgi:uncharacterized protein YbbC (DUF1343 family)